jgi:peroxin-11B
LAKESKALKGSQTWGDKDLAEEATRETKLSSNITYVTFSSILPTFYTGFSARKSNQQQIVLDLLDIWIPATGAGLLHMNEGILGIVG